MKSKNTYTHTHEVTVRTPLHFNRGFVYEKGSENGVHKLEHSETRTWTRIVKPINNPEDACDSYPALVLKSCVGP